MGVLERIVLTLDVVDFSQIETNEQQLEVIQTLIRLLRQAIPDPKIGLWSPAGDGGSFTFLEDNSAAITTAVALGRLINAHNQEKAGHPFQLRMGIHIGPVSKETDFDERENVWGNGINISARVTSMAKPGQILVSQDVYDSLGLKTWPKGEVTPISKRWAKHRVSLDLYNIYKEKDQVGIPPEDLEEWYGPFQYPLQQAIDLYEAMLDYQTGDRDAFRALMVAKRLLDLQPKHERAQKAIKRISKQWGRFERNPLYDDFFSALSPSALVYFFRNAEFSDYRRGQTIVEEGEPADSLMMVVSGEVSLEIGTERLAGIVLREGDVVGEMGLFNPGGKRTASLIAAKNTITLTLNYSFLTDVSGAVENDYRHEIKAQIWEKYRDRVRQNTISRDPLLAALPDDERSELLPISIFLPDRPEQPVTLSAEQVWDKWIMVVSGKMIVSSGDRRVEYATGERHSCFGPLRFVKEECPFSQVEFSPNTQLVCLPWDTVETLASQVDLFGDKCFLEGRRDRTRYQLK